MSILYYLGKANLVDYSLSTLSMSSTAHVEDEKGDLDEDLQKLARLGVRLMVSTEGGIVVTNGADHPLCEISEREARPRPHSA